MKNYILDTLGRPIYYDPKTIVNDAVRDHVIGFQDMGVQLDFEVPKDPQLFYESFGLMPHPRLKDLITKRPIPVEKLTPYQIRWWKERNDLATPKSNKVGLTTTSGLELFQSRLLPEEAGYDALWVAQTQRMANEHILNLKTMIRWSKNYSKFMITRPDIELFREEKSKASILYIANPYDKKRPSRIIGIGASESSAFSWKYVNRVHGADISLIKSKDQKSFFAGLYSRLANTSGIVKFESVPNGQQGEFWNIVNKSRYHIDVDNLDDDIDPEGMASDFKVWDIPYTEGIASNVITPEFIDKQKRRLGDLLFSQTYECNFLPPGNQWYKPGWFKADNYTVGW